jgi:hypothetical protein
MSRFASLRPTPAMAVALIALFVSLGGVSYGVATGSIDSREIKNNTVRSRDLRNHEVRGRDIRNSTVRGPDVALNTLGGLDIDESKLGRVPSADVAVVAVSPLAYARVDSSGNVVDADSSRVQDPNVSNPGPGRYCFHSLGFGFRTAQVTVDFGDPLTGGDDDLIAQVAKGNPEGDCPFGNQLEVATSQGGAASPAGFYVWFFG